VGYSGIWTEFLFLFVPLVVSLFLFFGHAWTSIHTDHVVFSRFHELELFEVTWLGRCLIKTRKDVFRAVVPACILEAILVVRVFLFPSLTTTLIQQPCRS